MEERIMENSELQRYAFAMTDGSYIAVYATSQCEAAKKVREMLNA